MKSKALLFITLLISCTGILSALEDARTIPFYLRADFDEIYPDRLYFPSTHKYIPTPMPPEAYKLKPGPDRILNGAGFELINVSRINGHQSETWIAYNPTNPKNIITTANDFNYNYRGVGYRMTAWYTTDGGYTWAQSNTPSNIQAGWIKVPASVGATNFDPGIAFDSKGQAFYTYGFCQTTQNGDGEADNGVFVTRSTDGGKTWGDIYPIATQTQGSETQAFYDRYSIACDNNPNSPFKDKLYVTWQRFKQNPAVILSTSTDNGELWTTPSIIGTGETQAPVPAIGPDGEVYIVWRSTASNSKTDAMLVKSTNGGATWNSPQAVMTVKTIGTVNTDSKRFVFKDKQSIRVSSVANAAVDCSPGPRRGWVYVAMAGKEDNGLYGIYISRSTDGGKTWEKNIRIDKSTLRNDMFFPSICVDPVTGLVAVLYYSSENDPDNHGVDAYLAYSLDGITFENIRITPTSAFILDSRDVSMQGSGNYYWGDYTSITAYDGVIYPLFWMPTATTAEETTLEVFTAIITDAPKPPENFTTQNDIGTQVKVQLKWTDPTKDLFNKDLTDFKIHVYRDAVKLAEVDKAAQQYVDATAVDGQVYTYKIKTVKSSGSSSVFVESTIITGGSPEPNPPTEVVAKPNKDGVLLLWKNPSTHIDGTNLRDFEKVNIYSDGTLAKSVGKEQIQAGEYALIVVNLPVSKFYKIILKAVGKRGTVETESVASDEVLAYSGEPLKILSEGFDATQTTPFYTNGRWGKSTTKALTLPYSFTDSPTGNYGNGEESYLIFAPFVIGQTDTTLSFEHIAVIEKSDWGSVSISADFGKSWREVRRYDMESSPKFTGNIATSDWDSVHVGLKKYIGDTLYVKLSMVSNLFKNNDGWYIDNLRLDDNPNAIGETPAILYSTFYIYPNPTTGSAQLDMSISSGGRLLAEIYDNLGNRIAKLADATLYSGDYSYPVNLAGLGSGLYYCRISLDGMTKTLPLVIVR